MKSLGVRKGPWSGEEDVLLKRCVELHGEGNWHLVPQRAGLNRCRKSCRLRWLNYLRPNLNREEFKEDESDLIIKMHKLLGNRWSLIAGRIPGRTANDIKNYWNSRLSKRFVSQSNESPYQPLKRKRDEVIKPQPRSFKIKLPSQLPNIDKTQQQQQEQEEQKQHAIPTPMEGQNMLWNELLLEDDTDSSQSTCDINEGGLLKGFTAQGTELAMDPERVKFDASAFEWDDILVINDWPMQY